MRYKCCMGLPVLVLCTLLSNTSDAARIKPVRICPDETPTPATAPSTAATAPATTTGTTEHLPKTKDCICKPAPPIAQPAKTTCNDGRPVMAAAGPWVLGVDAGPGMGLFFATTARLTVFVGRRFWDRLDLQLSYTSNLGYGLVGNEVTGQVGLVLPMTQSWEIAMAWKTGYALFWVQTHLHEFVTSALTMTMLLEFRWLLLPQLELRIAAFSATGYWNEIWGFVVDPRVGVAWRF